MEKTKLRLSASRIKTASNCSWLYYCKYHLNLPDSSNTGARLGSVCHSVLENLANKKRQIVVDQILQSRSIYVNPVIERYSRYLLQKERELSVENLKKINDFILTALENDFYGEGSIDLKTEHEFDLQGDGYRCYGFIDVIQEYDYQVKIIDYKTSKSKFAKGSLDMTFNLQALIYSLVAKQMFPTKDISVEFLFLKFPKAPSIKMSFTEQQLKGFEDYLRYIYEYLSNYTVENAMSDFAADAGFDRAWLCGSKNVTPHELKDDGSPKWYCSCRFPFYYFSADKPDHKSVTAYKKKDLDKYAKLGYTVVQKRYNGCPRFN